MGVRVYVHGHACGGGGGKGLPRTPHSIIHKAGLSNGILAFPVEMLISRARMEKGRPEGPSLALGASVLQLSSWELPYCSVLPSCRLLPSSQEGVLSLQT